MTTKTCEMPSCTATTNLYEVSDEESCFIVCRDHLAAFFAQYGGGWTVEDYREPTPRDPNAPSPFSFVPGVEPIFPDLSPLRNRVLRMALQTAHGVTWRPITGIRDGE